MNNIITIYANAFTKKLVNIIIVTLLVGPIWCTVATAQTTPFKLTDNTTIQSLHRAMQTHQLTCVQLINDYLIRIKNYDLNLSRGAPINAFVAINPNIFSAARQLDHYYDRTGHFTGPLHCIPVIVKDNIDTIDTPSTSGSLSLLGSQPNTDAFLVQKIRAAGGIIIGKGAMDEFASGMSGMSSRSGRVGNAYDPNQTPGGSSAGPAAAVSANFAMIGIGTDNSGSVRIPAAFNGIDGIRPSTGLISQTGIFPRGNLDGVAGVMARNIPDLAITLSVISHTADPKDPKTLLVPDYIRSDNVDLTTNNLSGKRIGIITSVGGKKTFDKKNVAAMAIFNQTFHRLKTLGATLIPVTLPKFVSDRQNNMAGEIQDVNHYLLSFPSTRQSYRDICTSGRAAVFGSINDCLKHIKDTAPKNGKIYKQVLAMFKQNRKYVEQVMRAHHLTALIMPLNAEGGPSYDVARVNTWRAAVSSNSGLPAMTLIGGYTSNNMPVGLELIGKMYGDKNLLSLAYTYEKHFPKRKPPTLPASKQPSPLLSMSIAQINNLLTLIGYRSYLQFLQHSDKMFISPEESANVVKQSLALKKA